MIQRNVDLKPYNTFGISEKADRFATFRSIRELDEILENNREQPLLILGGGSNILLTKTVEKLVLKNEVKGIEVVKEDRSHVWVKAAGGEVWHEFVLYCIEKGWGGIENMSLIPGCVGAAPMQNIGAYGVEIKDVFVELEAYEISTGKLRIFTNEECEFGYRESVFKRKLKNQFGYCQVG